MVTQIKKKQKKITVDTGRCPICGCDADAWREVFGEAHTCYEPDTSIKEDCGHYSPGCRENSCAGCEV